MDSEDLTLKILAEELRLYKPPHSIPIQQSGSDSESARPKPNRAAVLICLFQGENGDLRVILTKRSSTLSAHSGEVSLPGGKREEGDADDIETAMREAKEEIGLDPSLVNAVTVLEPFVNKDENRRAEEREWMGDKYLLQYFDYEAENERYVIWALTAGILIRTASIVYQRPPAFLERKPKFWSRIVN
ncbi:hypothetical protein PVL29_012992 [Vitis rotundifolia]|uniref:Nudix hydrolase domain-containing protein n=1 Tax=Vitis rotundifolia TaxID=103349 RepID=A0AA38ZLV9_VITRO|nr:hypothetical protein PVL29_012992 [Vitis rotundifolia]